MTVRGLLKEHEKAMEGPRKIREKTMKGLWKGLCKDCERTVKGL